MKLLLLILCLAVAAPQVGTAVANTTPTTHPTTIPAQAEHGLPREALEIGRFFGFPITNSMLVTWLTALVLIVVVQFGTRKMKLVPSGIQNFVEWLVDSLRGFLEGIIGKHLVDRTFWFFASIFIFVLFTNWVGLIPGVGIRLGTPDPARIPRRSAPLPRRQRRSQPDSRHGPDF